MSEYGIRLEFTNHVAVITVDRPQRMNTFNETMWSELERITTELRENLPRVIVLTGAGDMILTTREVKAREALALGLINRVSSPAKVLEESVELAEIIAGKGPRTVRSALEVIRSACGMSLQEALELETKKAIALITSGECYHGISAFLSKEKSRFPDIK